MITTPSHARPSRAVSSIVATLVVMCGATYAADDEDDDVRRSAIYESGVIQDLNDLRFGYGILPSKANITILDRSGNPNPNNYDKQTYFDKTGRTGFFWMTPWSQLDEDGGFLFGLEFTTNHYVLEASSTEPYISYRSFVLTAHPGIGWGLSPHLELEIAPFFGLGVSSISAGSGLGTYFELGLRTGLVYTFGNRFQIGANLAYMYSHSKEKFSANGADFDAVIRTDGLAAGLQFGYRFR